MIAYVFPGQGSQFAGMGKQIAGESAIAEEVLRVVDDALGFSLTEIMFGEDADALTPTEIQQPAIFAHSVATFAALRKRHAEGPALVAGHSLGEYSAVVAAGCLELEEAARLVRKRGELMAAAASQVGGAMAAILKMETADVEQLVQDAAGEGVLSVANFNSPGQVVISGEKAAVDAACALAKERGGRSIPLKVSGAFHSPLMAPAAEMLRPELEAVHLSDATVPIVSNVDATARTEADGIRQALIHQVTGSVRWEDSVRTMIAQGVDCFVEVGPGNVLAKLIERIDSNVRVASVGTLAEINAFVESLG
ncbi:MAG: ACP S-malonyltransferase [Armatimonadetes bacterium]|nr:ACP S-malonyltransferase [Armatimonadota bacterium]